MSDKNDLRGAPAAIGMTVLALLFGGVVLAIYPGWVPIGEFINENLKLTENAPAWVQAVGSILAIFSAVYVVNLQNKKNREINYNIEISKKIYELDSLMGVFKVVYRIFLTLDRNMEKKKKIANKKTDIAVPIRAWHQMVDILMDSQSKFSYSISTRIALHLLAEIQNTSSQIEFFNGKKHDVKAIDSVRGVIKKRKKRIERLCRFTALYKKHLEGKLINN